MGRGADYFAPRPNDGGGGWVPRLDRFHWRITLQPECGEDARGGGKERGGRGGGAPGSCALHAGETAVPPSEPAGAATAQLRVTECLDVLAVCRFAWCHAGGGGEVLA